MTNLGRTTVRALVVALLAIQVPPASAPPPARADAPPAACPDERPDAGAARSTAGWCGKRVEITGLASETTRVWANPDGTLTADVTAGPSRVRRGQRWQDTDLRLRRTADGSVEPVAHPRGLRLSGRRADGTHALATVAAGDDSLALQWTGALPEPRLDGHRATYPDARPGVDLVVEATSTGFEQFLVVKHPAAAAHAATLTLPLVSHSLTLVDQGQGALGVVDAGGRVVGRVPAPRMWDGTRTREKAVGVTATGGPGRADLALHADRTWLDDPATAYPVTIDPSVTINPTGDTYVKQGVTIDHSGATDLQLGNSGGVARSFLQWPTAAFAHGRITSATLKFWNFWSGSCTPAAWEVWTAAPYTNPITWSTQPALLVREGTSSETKGFDASCDDNWVGVDATSFFQRAADSGADKAHMGLKAAVETGSWKQFRSMQGGAAVMPRVTITYSAAPRATTPTTSPATGDCATGAGRPYTSSRTPRLSATVADEDSATVSAAFEWWSTGGAKIGGATASAPAGSTAAVTVPSGAFADGGTYSWRVQASDGTNASPWSPWCEVTVDSTAPSGAPTVTSSAFPEGVWSGAAGREGAVSFGAAGASDVVSYRYGLDTNPPTETVPADVPGGGATAVLTPASDGPHTLFVRSADRAGNLSPVRAYTFYVGSAAVLSPDDGDVTPGTTSLQGQAPSGATGVTYQWRRADVDDWRTVPTGDVAVATGGGVTWPAPVDGDGTTTKLNWDVTRTVGAVDGPVQVRAVFTGGGTSTPVHFTVDRDRGTAARTDVGPGSVNLLSG
ncbi:MAG: DNRLRE domain-containing protein, partial [Saccharothrix sp.]|nr:DNRLRE domain-containing protein [Saccharothrix sp.]